MKWNNDRTKEKGLENAGNYDKLKEKMTSLEHGAIKMELKTDNYFCENPIRFQCTISLPSEKISKGVANWYIEKEWVKYLTKF